MKNKILSFTILLVLAMQVSVLAQTSEIKAIFIEAQTNQQQVKVTLNNGNTYTGMVVTVDQESAGVRTEDGLFNFRYDRIASVVIVNPDDITSGWRENIAKNKLFFFQTGKMLEPKSGYYQNTYIFFSNFAYGITENISLDAGFSMIPGLGIDNQLYSVGAKIGTSVSNTVFISANVKHYSLLDVGEGVTSVFGSATLSKSRLDLTVSTGLGFADGGNTDLTFILGGQFRVSERFAFLSENLTVPDGTDGSEAILSLGGRIIGSKSAFDLGFFTVTGDFFLPFVSYTIKL